MSQIEEASSEEIGITMEESTGKSSQSVTDTFWLGNCMALWYHKHNPRILIGPLCLCSLTVIVGFSGAYLFWVLLNKNVYLTAIGIVLLLFEMVTYGYTALANPGMPDRDLSRYKQEYVEQLIREKSFTYCPKCKLIKNLRVLTQHCEYCQICVEGYDHHCPWTGKCIGKGNTVSFNMFVGGFLALMVFIILSTVTLA